MTRTLASLLALLLGLAALPAADPPAEPLKVPPRPLEELKVPPGTVVVPDLREGLGKIDGIFLSPDEYRKLVEAAQQAAKKPKSDKPPPPSVCRLSGKVGQRGMQEVVSVRAEFEFASAAPRMTYSLGFRRAAAVAATLDAKQLPALEDGPDGLLVTVEAPGRHTLVLDLELPLQARGSKGGERGFALNLPGSPITRLEQFELPPGVASVRLRPLAPVAPPASPPPARTLAAKDLRKPAGDGPALALGPVEGVELYWDDPEPQRPAEPLLTADGDIRVQVGEAYVQVTASLLLRSRRGRVTEWRLLTPPGADVTLPGQGTDPGPTVKPLDDDKSQWLVRTEGGVEGLTVEVQTRQARQPGKAAPVGPFNLIGAFRQQGTMRVLAPNNLRPQASRLRNDVERRELPADSAPPGEAKAEFLQAAYGYGQVTPSSPAVPLLHVDAEAVRGGLRTQVTHRLTLVDGRWRLATEIKATPIRAELESLEVEVPAALQPSLEAGPPELVERIEPADAAANRWRVRLAHPRRAETTVRLEAVYPQSEPPAEGRETATLLLPRVRQAYDTDGRVTVTVPDDFETNGTVREWDRDRMTESGRPLERLAGTPSTSTLTTPRSPAAVELSWAARAATVPVKSVADVTLHERQVAVGQRLTLPASAAIRTLVLRPVGPLLNQVRAVSGGTLAARGEREWLLTVPAGPDREAVVLLAYSQPVTPAVGRLEVGLLWPATAGQAEFRARIWTGAESGLRPNAAGPWEELPLDPVPERETLPALALLAGGPPASLTLDLTEAAGLAPAAVIAERVLIQVVADDVGQHHYLARFRLRKVAAESVDVELPEPVATLAGLEVYVGAKRVEQPAVVDGAVGNGRVIRIPLTAEGTTADLSVGYFLGGARPGGLAARRRLDLAPPRLRGRVFVGPVRWHVLPPEDQFALPAGGQVQLEQRWGLRRFFPVPLAARDGRELEEWFRGGPVEGPAGPVRGTLLRAAGLEPVHLVLVPRLTWYLACSFVALGLGGALVVARRSRWVFWPLLTLLLASAGAAVLLWPQTTALVAAGSLPGVIVVAGLLAVTAWQARRYYRRVVFLPGFSRTKPSSTAARPASSQRRRQPSTVDAPPVA